MGAGCQAAPSGRRSGANWVAGLLVRGMIDQEDAYQMSAALAYDLAKSAYNL